MLRTRIHRPVQPEAATRRPQRAGTPASPCSRRSMLLAPLVLACAPLAAAAQEDGPSAPREAPEPPAVTALAGVGLSMGWFGGQVSAYTLDGRLSGHVGAGYTPDNGEGHPEGVAFAGGVRAFTAGPTHRWFAGVAYGLLVTVSEVRPGPDEGERVYGPALLIGYQFTAANGFTVLVGAGAGYSGSSRLSDQDIVPTIDLGLGYTWH